LDVNGRIRYDSATEYSPLYVGDALSAIKAISFEPGSIEGEWGDVDHDTLPEGVRVDILEEGGWLKDNETGEEIREEEVKEEVNIAFEEIEVEDSEPGIRGITGNVVLGNDTLATSVGGNLTSENGSSPDADVAQIEDKNARIKAIKERKKEIKGERREKIEDIKAKIETKGYSNAEEYIEDNYESIIEKLVPGRDVGKSIQLNTRAIQQLIGIIESGEVNITSTASPAANINETSEQLGISKVNGSVIIRLG